MGMNKHSIYIDEKVDFRSLDDKVFSIIEEKPTKRYIFALLFSSLLATIGVISIGYSIAKGLGVWGVNSPVFWGFAIINFVFWIGIGHAGTLISAILFLLRSEWRTAIARFSEAMTIFAVMVAGIFPLIHVGRPWLAFWLFPYPNERGIWINFRSPLVWDVFAVSTYFTVSLIFFYTGLIPDFASLREKCKNPLLQKLFALLSLGWTGSVRAWQHYEKAYTVVAGLATGLVLSVHSVVSFDFAVSVVPGWHMTIFPPYFVAGAIFAGFAMVQIVLIIVRFTLGLNEIITDLHFDRMSKMILGMSLLMAYSYFVEGFTAFYSMNPSIQKTFINYITPPYGFSGILTIFLNVIVPQLFWFKRLRKNFLVMLFVSISVTVGMWFERFTIIVISLYNDYLPSSKGLYIPTIVDFGILIGSFGIFSTLVLLFAKFMPIIATTEMKHLIEKGREKK